MLYKQAPIFKLATMQALFLQSSWLLFTLIGMFVVIVVIVLLLVKPLVLHRYLLRVRRGEKQTAGRYIPIKVLTSFRQAMDTSLADSTGPMVAVRNEELSLLDLLRQQEGNQLLLGAPGIGKTIVLRAYQYHAAEPSKALLFGPARIPVYVPMKDYSLYLKRQYVEGAPAEEGKAQELDAGLLDFLYASDLPALGSLRRYLKRLAARGRLLLLCDGLDDVDSDYRTLVSNELVNLMQKTENRCVVTCREGDYREWRKLVQRVEKGRITQAVISPLSPEQIHACIEHYIERQDKQWRHTAGQIIQLIDRCRLMYHCTNPMLLLLLLGIIDTLGVERGKQVDTRGRLLREAVRQLIEDEKRRTKRQHLAPDTQEVVRLLSEVACAARWTNERGAIQLRVAIPVVQRARGREQIAEWANELQYWLEEHVAQGPFVEAVEDNARQPYEDITSLLQCALGTGLVEISAGGVLSFCHEVIAAYFVAEYFFAATTNKRAMGGVQAIREELLLHVQDWSEPVALWAGFLEKPQALAERFGVLARSNPTFVLQALTLALVSLGVAWMPPRMDLQCTVALPASVAEVIAPVIRNKAAREKLARMFANCLAEGSQELYHSLLPLTMIEGIEDLLILLDQDSVSQILFTHLQDAVDNVAYDAQIKRIVRVLGRFGGGVVHRAAQLSVPRPDRSLRLRVAAINILGGTRDARAVEPLIERLQDTDAYTVERAMHALLRLGAEVALAGILRELEDRTARSARVQVHRAALMVLGYFCGEKDLRRQLTVAQYTRVLEAVAPVLTANYQHEPEVQQLARKMLVKVACDTEGAGARDNRWEKVIDVLLRYLPAQNEVTVKNVILAFQEIGTIATPRLLEQCSQPVDAMRARIVEILRVTHDPRSLPILLRLLADPSVAVRQQVDDALRAYQPESIPGLINVVLESLGEDVAERAAHILAGMGSIVIESITQVIFQIVPERTRLLVSVLAQVHDVQVIPTLITVLQSSHSEPLLTIAIIRALAQFDDPRGVTPLLALLEGTQPLVYEEAINALSQLGMVALDELIAALEVQRTAAVIQRIQRALLGMVPFPGEALVAALEQSSRSQAQHIVVVMQMQGAEAARVLARHVLHQDERVRGYICQALTAMPGSVAVPALLEMLDQPAMQGPISALLLKHPSAAISPLVELLSEPERGGAAEEILPLFGTAVLVPLLSGVYDPGGTTRERAQRILVILVTRSKDEQQVVREIVQLFTLAPPPGAYEMLLSVLSNELADVSMPVLLEGLEDAHLIADVAETFLRLAQREELRAEVLDQLLQTLLIDERRRGAANALVKIGSYCVEPVGELITEQNAALAKIAREILREIGKDALGFIWKAHSDTSNPSRRAAALDIFYSMRTEIVKDKLIASLDSRQPDEVAMAVALLLERIRHEAEHHYADREMIPLLIEYMQTYSKDATNLRILALLLLVGEQAMIEHLIQALNQYPQHRKQLVYVFLLLGNNAQQHLLDVFNDPDTKVEVRAELATVLGMSDAPEAVADYAQNISAYGISTTHGLALFPDQLAIALRALGGLLASSYWNTQKLQELRGTTLAGTPAHELFSILLGWRYEPQIEQLYNELQGERDARRKEFLLMTTHLMSEQQEKSRLANELEEAQREHTSKTDELRHATRKNEEMRTNIDKIKKEKDRVSSELSQLTRERDRALANSQKMMQERDRLATKLESTLQENKELFEKNQQLSQHLEPPRGR